VELSSCNKLSSSERLLLKAAELCAAAEAVESLITGCELVMMLLLADADGHFIDCTS